MNSTKFTFTNNYNKELGDYINEIINNKEYTQESRIPVFDKLINDFIEATGERPKYTYLNRITNSILKEDLANRQTNKRTNSEYPILSINQIKRRLKQEPIVDITEMARYYGSDGKNYKEKRKGDGEIPMSKEEQEAVAEFFRNAAKDNGMNVK